MSELISKQGHRNVRWQLLTTVSALSLTLTVSAHAESSDNPTVWIELGGQLERIGGLEDPYLPAFTTKSPTPAPFTPISPTEAQKPSIYSYGGEGSISLHPHGTEWSFTAAIRYGRSNNNKHVHQQTQISSRYPNAKYHGTPGVAPFKTRKAPQFADFRTKNSESHSIIDFKVGRDVGLGFFSTTASFGVRVASFDSKSNVSMIARPDVSFPETAVGLFHAPAHADYFAEADNEHSFRGIGPSISWNGDVPVFGDEDRAITFDWGVNAAVLFGRQKAGGSHHEIARYYTGLGTGSPPPGVTLIYNHPTLPHNRSRSVVVPNIGGLAGLSFRYSAAKISFGYRADLFLGAMDTGIDQRHTGDRNFYGPFATISIGLGG